jgi:transcriptional regulator with XRE-family HTH domain
MATRLGMTLKKLRINAGLTQEELAKKGGVTYAYISMLESGAKKNPSLALVKKLAKALKVKVGELLE